MKLSIIIPAYNEEKRIGPTLDRYCSFFGKLALQKKMDFEIIVILNACEDNTLKIVQKFKEKCKQLKYLEFKQSGKGFAIIEGFKDAIKRKNDIIGFVDSDMSTSPESFYDIVKKIEGYDGVIASRYIKGAIVKPKQNLQRIFLSRIFNIFIRATLMMPYKDTQCGAKLFTKKSIEKSIEEVKFSRWAFDVDLLYCMRQNGFKIKEVSTVWCDKEYSVINFKKAGIRMGLAIIRLRILHSPFKRFIKIYDKIVVKFIGKMFRNDLNPTVKGADNVYKM